MTLPVIECPASLKASGFSLAPEGAADVIALRAIHRRQRMPEFALLAMPEAGKRMLLDSQFDMQRKAYRMSHPDALFLALGKAGATVGRLYLASDGMDIVLLDILIAEEIRGAGVGGALIAALVKAAFAAGQAVRLHVDKTNRARGLYEKLGFRVTGDAGVSWAMAARPG